MRKPKLYLGLIVAVTLFASTIPAAASHPAPITMGSDGIGWISNWPLTSSLLGGSPGSHELDSIASSTCSSIRGDAEPTDSCTLFLADIQLTPVNGMGPNCESFAGAGGWGHISNDKFEDIELSDVGFDVRSWTTTLLGDQYLIALHGKHTLDGATRPFVGEMVWQTQRCGTAKKDYTNGAFTFRGHLTLL